MFRCISVLFFLLLEFSFSQIRIEAESGIFTNSIVENSIIGFSGEGYVSFYESNSQLTISIGIEKSSVYKIGIRYCTFGSTQEGILKINDIQLSSLVYEDSSDVFTDFPPFYYFLEEGNNTLNFIGNWGDYAIDYVEIEELTEEVDYGKVETNLIDPLATKEAKDLYENLRSVYGKKTISGQTTVNYNYTFNATGKYAGLRGYDLGLYSPQYAYKWCNDIDDHCFGAVDEQITEGIINDYFNSNGNLIVAIQWHWYSPSGKDQPGTGTFYSDHTSFDVRQGVIQGTEEYNQIINDLDIIADELKKLSENKIPVLWRPLHEPDGMWFWWGKYGKEACLQLYDIMFDRFTNHHDLHNLIWVWGKSVKNDWWPGNDKADIFGISFYDQPFDYRPLEEKFYDMYHFLEGKKMITISENGAIPDFAKNQKANAMWLYFSTWEEHIFTHNSEDHLNYIYNNDLVLTLDELEEEFHSKEEEEDGIKWKLVDVFFGIIIGIVVLIFVFLVLIAVGIVVLIVIKKNSKERRNDKEMENV